MRPGLMVLLAGISTVRGFIIPEELPSLLSLLYSNIPPIKKGTDSRVGFGFRLGPHADVQFLLELGPQSNTASIGPDAEPFPGKRETLQMENTETLVAMVNNMRMPQMNQDGQMVEKPEVNEIGAIDDVSMDTTTKSAKSSKTKKDRTKKTTESAGTKWLDTWKSAFQSNNYYGKINFKKVPGIDSKSGPTLDRRRSQMFFLAPEITTRPNYVDQLRQLYKPQPITS